MGVPRSRRHSIAMGHIWKRNGPRDHRPQGSHGGGDPNPARQKGSQGPLGRITHWLWYAHFGKVYALLYDYPVMRGTVVLTWLFTLVLLPFGTLTAGLTPTRLLQWMFNHPSGPPVSILSLCVMTAVAAMLISMTFVALYNILRCVTCCTIDGACICCCGRRRHKK